MVKLLIQHGADAARIDAKGRTPLLIGQSRGFKDVAAYLRSKGARKPVGKIPAATATRAAAKPSAKGAPPSPVPEGLLSGNLRWLVVAGVAVLFVAMILVVKKVLGGREPEVAQMVPPPSATSEPQPAEPVAAAEPLVSTVEQVEGAEASPAVEEPAAFELETPAVEPPTEPEPAAPSYDAAPAAPAFDVSEAGTESGHYAEPSFEIPAAPAFDLPVEEAAAPEEALEEPAQAPVEPEEKPPEIVFDLSEEPPKKEDTDK